jgi:hypothetical protein
LNGALTRLLDPDKTLRARIIEFVGRGDFGLASGARADGSYERVWYAGPVTPEEVAFESGVFLLKRETAEALRRAPVSPVSPEATAGVAPPIGESAVAPSDTTPTQQVVRLVGAIPPELWNRLGTKVLPKLRVGSDLRVAVEFSVTVESTLAEALQRDLEQILADLDLTGKIEIRRQSQ